MLLGLDSFLMHFPGELFRILREVVDLDPHFHDLSLLRLELHVLDLDHVLKLFQLLDLTTPAQNPERPTPRGSDEDAAHA